MQYQGEENLKIQSCKMKKIYRKLIHVKHIDVKIIIITKNFLYILFSYDFFHRCAQ
jgi:hypothetical protein